MKKEKILFTTEIDYNLVKNDLEYFLEVYNLPENLTFKEVKENHREDMQDFIDTNFDKERIYEKIETSSLFSFFNSNN